MSLVKYEDLDEKQQRAASAAIQSAWHYVAGDYMAARAENGDSGPCPQAEVVEITLDNEEVRDRISRGGDHELVEFFGFGKGQYDEQVKAAKIALPQKDWL